MEQTADVVQCVVCGNSVPRAQIDVVSEGPACPTCAAERQKELGSKLAPMAKLAAAAALVPALLSYRTTSVTGSGMNLQSTNIRILFLTMSDSRGGSVTVDGMGNTGATAAIVQRVFDPIGVGGGAIALLLGIAALVVLLRASPRSNKSLGVSAGAALVGIYFLLHGLGKV